MYKLLQPKENNICLCIAYLCHVQKAPMHTEEKTMPGNNKKKWGISFVHRSKVKRHTQIKTQYPLIFTIVCNSGNVLENKLSKYLTSKKTNLVLQYYN